MVSTETFDHRYLQAANSSPSATGNNLATPPTCRNDAALNRPPPPIVPPQSLHQFLLSLSSLILHTSTAHHLPTAHIPTGPQVLPVFMTPQSRNVCQSILLLPWPQETSINQPHCHQHPFVAPTVPKVKKKTCRHSSTTIYLPKTITA